MVWRQQFDERVKAESGPVKTTWAPELFDWFDSRVVTHSKPLITVRQRCIFIGGVPAIRLADVLERMFGPRAGRGAWRVLVGFTKRSVAIRPCSQGGWAIRGEGAGRTPGLLIEAKSVHREFINRGFAVGTSLEAVWDEEHGMVVGQLREGDR